MEIFLDILKVIAYIVILAFFSGCFSLLLTIPFMWYNNLEIDNDEKSKYTWLFFGIVLFVIGIVFFCMNAREMLGKI